MEKILNWVKKNTGLIVIILGSFSWLLTIFKSGLRYGYGLGFWGANGHDGIWHIALSSNLSNLNFENPVFAGEKIKNYHIGFDLILGLISKITQIPLVNLYFQVLPVILSLAIGILTYQFVENWTKSKSKAFLSTLFVYLGGSMSWILGKGESAFWSAQSISTLINPPFSLSVVIMLLGLLMLLKKKSTLAAIFFGLLIFIKVYAGLLMLAGLFMASVYEYFVDKKTDIFKVFILSLVISILLFVPFNINSTGLIKFQPFWFLETMMSYSDRLGWQKYYSAMTNYKLGGVYLKYLASYAFAFLIFIIGNFWTRLVFLKNIFSKLDKIKVTLLTIIAAGAIVPTFFVQEGTPWNTIQFIYYSLFFAGILAGTTLSEIYQKGKLAKFFTVVLILLTLPTTIITLKEVYMPMRAPAKLTYLELDALNFLKKQPKGVVLTYPFDKYKAEEAVSNPPRPLYLYDSTAYVSAFSGKTVYLEDEVNLNILNYNWQERRELVLNWYKEADSQKARDFLSKNNIKYVYWLDGQRALLGEGQLGLKKIFENKEVIIYEYGSSFSNN